MSRPSSSAVSPRRPFGSGGLAIEEKNAVTGVLYTPQLGREPGHKVPFVSDADPKMKSDPAGRRALGSRIRLSLARSRPRGRGTSSRRAASRKCSATKKKQSEGDRRAPAQPERRRARNVDGDHDRDALGSRGAAARLPTVARRCQREGRHTDRKVRSGRSWPSHPWDEMLRGLSSLHPKRRSLPRCRQNFGTCEPPIFRRCFGWSTSSTHGVPRPPTSWMAISRSATLASRLRDPARPRAQRAGTRARKGSHRERGVHR